jgi:hypothetical protein
MKNINYLKKHSQHVPKGIHFAARSGKWVVKFCYRGRYYYRKREGLGEFKELKDAVVALKTARKKAHREWISRQIKKLDEGKTKPRDSFAQNQKSAPDYLHHAIHTLSQRAREYDSPAGEKSIGKTVEIFNSLTGTTLSESDGWLFMVCLKLVRSRQGDFKEDTFVDLAAYSALCGEAQSSDDEYDPEMLGVNT